MPASLARVVRPATHITFDRDIDLDPTARGATVDEVQRDVAIRPATSADTAAIRGLWVANGAVIHEGGVDMLTPYLAHLLLTGRVLAAVDDERVVGFGAVVERAGVTHLADLFVDPDRFEQGIGSRLLASLFGDAVLRTTFASSDPRALPLYVRSGMTPLWPNLYLDVDSSRLPPASHGLACEPAEPTRWRRSNKVGWATPTPMTIASGRRCPPLVRSSSLMPARPSRPCTRGAGDLAQTGGSTVSCWHRKSIRFR